MLFPQDKKERTIVYVWILQRKPAILARSQE